MMSAEEHAQSGQDAMRAGRYEDAVRAFHDALMLAPEIDALHFHYASALVWRGLPTAALPSLDQCVTMQGPWAAHASALGAQIRRQLGLPLHGLMIMPGTMPRATAPTPSMPSPMTTMTGTPLSFASVARRIEEIRRQRRETT